MRVSPCSAARRILALLLVCLLLCSLAGCRGDDGLTLSPSGGDGTDSPPTVSDGGGSDGGGADGSHLSADDLKDLTDLLSYRSVYGLPRGEYGTMSGADIVAATNDPYAAYYTAEEYAAYTASLSGSLVGIGVVVSKYTPGDGVAAGTDTVRLLCVYPDSPAARAGLLAGDLLTAVNGTPVSETGYDAALDAVKGNAGTVLTVTYLRAGDAPVTVSVTRADCTKQTVVYRIYTDTATGKKVGYLLISAFDAVTAGQFIDAVSALESAGVDSLLFDLRANGGGYLRTVCDMLAYLLPDGTLCGTEYAADDKADYVVAAENGVLSFAGREYTTIGSSSAPLDIAHSVNLPMAVLVDAHTASAAELFTAALRDYAAEGKIPAVSIFGGTTYGKGCMQETYRLPSGCYVKLTVAMYNPPCGVNYDGVGITPTDEMEDASVPADRYLDLEDAVRTAALASLYAR